MPAAFGGYQQAPVAQSQPVTGFPQQATGGFPAQQSQVDCCVVYIV